MQQSPRIAILISGTGTNMHAILNAIKDGELDAVPVFVGSDKPTAKGLQTAASLGVPTRVFSYKEMGKADAEEAIALAVEEAGADWIVLAGFMRILSPDFVRRFAGRIINIHPALLPSFPGLHSWKQALDYGAKVAGCTVHFVDAGTDSGPIIVQRPVPVLEGDTPETLHARIQEQEHLAFPEALRLLAAGRLTVSGRRVVIAP